MSGTASVFSKRNSAGWTPNSRGLRYGLHSKSRSFTVNRCSMASKRVEPASAVGGAWTVPGDKSISHRAVILGALSNRVCTVENFLEGEDCLCTVEAFRAMGIKIERQGTHLQIYGQ